MKIFLHGADLFFAAKAKAMCDATGATMISLRGSGPFPETANAPVFVDLAGRDAAAAVAALKAAGAVPLIAFGSHIHAARLEEARAAGAEEAIPNSRFESRLRELLKAKILSADDAD